MTEAVRGRAATVAAVLAIDGMLHLYWATGSTWPARDARSLSYAVLGAEVPFTPPILLPLATLLFVAAAAVYGVLVAAQAGVGGGDAAMRVRLPRHVTEPPCGQQRDPLGGGTVVPVTAPVEERRHAPRQVPGVRVEPPSAPT